MGATGPTAMSSIFPRLLNNVIGTQFHLVKLAAPRRHGGEPILLPAVERGEGWGFVLPVTAGTMGKGRG